MLHRKLIAYPLALVVAAAGTTYTYGAVRRAAVSATHVVQWAAAGFRHGTRTVVVAAPMPGPTRHVVGSAHERVVVVLHPRALTAATAVAAPLVQPAAAPLVQPAPAPAAAPTPPRPPLPPLAAAPAAPATRTAACRSA
jgi:hypothetical protein